MFKHAAKWVISLSVLLAAVFALAPAGATFASTVVHGTTSRTACAGVTARFSPSVVRAGQDVTAFGAISNCSSGMENITVVLNTTGPCNAARSLSQPLILTAGQSPSGSRNFRAPSCKGTYSAHVTVYSGSRVINTTSASFRVH